MTGLNLARMLAESLAMQLASCPNQLVADALKEGANPRLMAGLQAARDAFTEHVTENDAEELMKSVRQEVQDGLAELDRNRRMERSISHE